MIMKQRLIQLPLRAICVMDCSLARIRTALGAVRRARRTAALARSLRAAPSATKGSGLRSADQTAHDRSALGDRNAVRSPIGRPAARYLRSSAQIGPEAASGGAKHDKPLN